ncbi:PrpF domain-containing protein [Sutcliffiella cohnii]|uniref:PrpF domain-containing protein n=1 Tax=Sutcliffiella cohnii TaxID=33932 RepID=UPI002E22A29F|nr:PrpF domain-containing protein [Sutcliffiella cohnii]
MILISQYSIPAVVYRGGTSRGLLFHEKDLPVDQESQKDIFLAGIDAYNPSQINGLGSGTSHTSKVMVIAPPTVDGADVDYTFYQVGIGEEIVDEEGTCGNLMSAIGAFSIDEGLVKVRSTDNYCLVSAFNRNIGKMIRMKVPVVNGKAKVSGDYAMPGVINMGAKIAVDILSPGGGKTGHTLPLGTSCQVLTEEKIYTASFVDIVNPFVFVAASEFGLKGSELNSELATDEKLLSELELIRVKLALKAGMFSSIEEARNAPAIPKIAMVAEPHEYVTSAGKTIKAEEVDIVAKMVSMYQFHRTFAGSGLYNLAASVLLKGSIPNQFFKEKDKGKERVIRIGHPEGIAKVRVAVTEDGTDVEFVGLDRTARRIMKGDLYIPK